VRKPGYLSLEANPSKKVSKTLSHINKADIVVLACIPSYLEGKEKNVIVQAQTRQRERSYLKYKQKQKGLRTLIQW
jgi:hypothetical protein